MAQTGAGMYKQNQAAEDDRAYQQKLADALSGSSDPATLARTLASTNDPALRAAGVQMLASSMGPKSAPEVKEVITNPLTGEKASVQWNPASGKWEPVMGGAQPAQKPATDENGNPITGDDFLKSVDPNTGSQVKAMVEGRMKFPGSFALKTPYWQNMLRMAAQYDPNFDENSFQVRANTRTDAESTKGKTNQTIVAANTSIEHLGHLSDAAEKLDNFNSLGPLNATANAALSGYRKQTQDPAQTNFNSIRDKYVEEVTKFYRGTGGTEKDIERDIANLQAANSMDQLREAIAVNAKLMQSKIHSMQDEYRSAMGGTHDLTVVRPKAQAAIDRINARAAGNTQPQQDQQQGQTVTVDMGGAQQRVQPATGPKIASKAEFDALPSGTQFLAPDGSVRVKP